MTTRFLGVQISANERPVSRSSPHRNARRTQRDTQRKVVLCDLVWKRVHAKPGVTAPVVRIGLGGKCFSLAAIR